MANINELDLTPFFEKAKNYTIRKQMIMDDTYTVEDLIIMGIKKVEREKKWQEKHGTDAKNAKIKALEAKLAELGIDTSEV